MKPLSLAIFDDQDNVAIQGMFLPPLDAGNHMYVSEDEMNEIKWMI